MRKRWYLFDVVLWAGLMVMIGGHEDLVVVENEWNAPGGATQDVVLYARHFQPMHKVVDTDPPARVLLLATVLVMIQITRSRRRIVG